MANRFMDETALATHALSIIREELRKQFKLENARSLLEALQERGMEGGLDESQTQSFARQLINELIDEKVFDIRPSDKASTPPAKG